MRQIRRLEGEAGGEDSGWRGAMLAEIGANLMPRRATEFSPRVLAMGTDHPKRRALMKGRQIEGPKKAEAG